MKDHMTFSTTHICVCRGKAWTAPPKGIVELDFVHMEKNEDPIMPEKDFKLLSSMLNQVQKVLIVCIIPFALSCDHGAHLVSPTCCNANVHVHVYER